MNNDDQNTIIKTEVDAILDDIITLYNQSGKRVSGAFEDALEAKYSNNKAEIYGVSYLAGRQAGKMPPVQAILKWIEKKGLKAVEENITSSSLAWAIAKSIAKKGTKPESVLKIYQEVITPKRIDSIIKKVSEFNVNLFVHEVETSLELLEKNI